MRKARAQENQQPSSFGKYIFEIRRVAAAVKAQLTAIFGLPVFVQIKHAGQLPTRVATKLVDVPGIAGTDRVAGEMTFEFKQSQLQRPIQCKP